MFDSKPSLKVSFYSKTQLIIFLTPCSVQDNMDSYAAAVFPIDHAEQSYKWWLMNKKRNSNDKAE